MKGYAKKVFLETQDLNQSLRDNVGMIESKNNKIVAIKSRFTLLRLISMSP